MEQTQGDCPTCTAKFFTNEVAGYEFMWDNSFDKSGRFKNEVTAF
jgi:hypothetical protein